MKSQEQPVRDVQVYEPAQEILERQVNEESGGERSDEQEKVVEVTRQLPFVFMIPSRKLSF